MKIKKKKIRICCLYDLGILLKILFIEIWFIVVIYLIERNIKEKKCNENVTDVSFFGSYVDW